MSARCWLALAALWLTLSTHAADLRIRYAETVQLQAPSAPGASKPGSGSLAFTAYGRAFQLELQANPRLASSLPASERSTVTPFKGVVTGIAGSWVRLMQLEGQFSGAIWDGEQLYLLAPASEVAASLDQPLQAGTDATLIFRVADTEGGAIGGTCATTGSGGNADRYGALIAELKGRRSLLQAAAIGGEIEVGVLGDAQFSAFGTAARIIARMNVVDGIFTEQLGILITPVDLTIFNGGNDPFTGTDAIDLLEQLRSYRQSRPALQTRGITHLMTGRNLDGNTAGIAYIGSVCDARHGVSLSEASGGDATAPLIIAHELGHNFGAPHDNEPGSVCAGTPGSYLMNPFLNGSDDFSQCSLQQMQVELSAAPCVLSPRIADVTVSFDTPTLRVPIHRPYSFPVTVTSLGDQPSENVRLTVAANGGFVLPVTSVAAPAGVTCSTQANGIACNFGTVAAGESRQVTITLPAFAGPQILTATATVTATLDRRRENNAQTATIEMFSGSDVSIARFTAPTRAIVDDIFEIAFDVHADGVDAASNAGAVLQFDTELIIDSASVVGGTCSVSVPMLRVTCQVGDIPVGESRRVVVRAYGTRGGATYQLRATVQADNDGSSVNNWLQFPLALDSRQDVALDHPSPLPQYRVLGQSFEVPVDVWSRGIESVNDVMLTLYVDASLTVQQVTTSAGTCQVSGTGISCALGTIAAGTSQRVTVTLIGSQLGYASILWRATATRNDDPYNDAISSSLTLRFATDVSVYSYGDRIGVEGPGQVFVGATAVGVNPSTDVVLRALLPASHPVTSASVEGGTCTTTANTAECLVPSLAVDQRITMTVNYTSDSPGAFTTEFSVTAAADGDATNNQISTTVTLAPYVDVRVQSEAIRIDTSPGQPFDIPVTIAADRRAVTGITFTVLSYSNITVESVSGGGSCSSTYSGIYCAAGDLPANGTRTLTITARVNADVEYSFFGSVAVYLWAMDDRDGSNNHLYIPINAVLRGDARLSVAQATLSAIRGQSVNLPAISVVGVRTLDNATLDFNLPASVSVMSTPYNCYSRPDGLRCDLGLLRAGTTVDMPISLIFASAGSATVGLQLSAAGDEDASNNTGSISVTVTEPASSGGGGGGGGGGGAVTWQVLLGLLLLSIARRFVSSPMPSS